MLFLLITHIRPIIEYCSCVWNTGYQGDLRALGVCPEEVDQADFLC